MAKKVPQDVAFRLAQKAREADKKFKATDKKLKAAEKKAEKAEKKAEKAEQKAEKAEQKAEESESKDSDPDDFDNFDDFDDFDEESEAPEQSGGDAPAVAETPESSDSGLDALLKQASDSESSELKVARANKLTSEGDFAGALEIWKALPTSEGESPVNWRGLASVLDARDREGDSAKATTAREHADRLETQAITDATGRNMEDIIADLLDDGELNFSAGSDAKDDQ